MSLNQSQQEAADAVLTFLLGPESFMRIDGPAGYGKTYLMSHIIDTVIPMYQQACTTFKIAPSIYSVELTATTNKAAAVLGSAVNRPTSTIYSYLGLRVNEWEGKSSIVQADKTRQVYNTLIFIDEASRIDSTLLGYIHRICKSCKIIFVSDKNQLGPVGENVSPIYKQVTESSLLATPMRNAGSPELQFLCNQLRKTVETSIFQNIETVPGIIDLITDEDAEQVVSDLFKEPSNNLAVAFTNASVSLYSTFIRELRGKPLIPVVGDKMINNTQLTNGDDTLTVEEQVTVTHVGELSNILWEFPDVMGYKMYLRGEYGSHMDVYYPEDRSKVQNLLKILAAKRDWTNYYYIKNTVCDLRYPEACTIHKSQGMSVDTVLIDLHDFHQCRDIEVASRLLYVAVSRAKHRVIFYGNLPSHGAFGTIIV